MMSEGEQKSRTAIEMQDQNRTCCLKTSDAGFHVYHDAVVVNDWPLFIQSHTSRDHPDITFFSNIAICSLFHIVFAVMLN